MNTTVVAVITLVLFIITFIANFIEGLLKDKKRKRLFLAISIISLFAALGGTIYLSFLPDF